jgi:hypothetical protein
MREHFWVRALLKRMIVRVLPQETVSECAHCIAKGLLEFVLTEVGIKRDIRRDRG